MDIPSSRNEEVEVQLTQTNADVITVLRRFKEINPWRGKCEERKAKYKWVFDELKVALELDPDWKIEFDVDPNIRNWVSSSNSYTDHAQKKITLRGRLSTITMLHEMWHAFSLSANQHEANAFAISHFKEVFPEKMQKLSDLGGLLVQKQKFVFYPQRD